MNPVIIIHQISNNQLTKMIPIRRYAGYAYPTVEEEQSGAKSTAAIISSASFVSWNGPRWSRVALCANAGSPPFLDRLRKVSLLLDDSLTSLSEIRFTISL